MGASRRIGYGANRKPADFASAALDDLYLDTERTGSVEREVMVRIGLRRGDTLVVLKISDLGAGKGLRNFKAAMADRGIEIEVFQPPKPEAARQGRPPAARLQDADWERLEAMWRDPASAGGYIIDKACGLMGLDKDDKKDREKARQRLYRRFKVKRSD